MTRTCIDCDNDHNGHNGWMYCESCRKGREMRDRYFTPKSRPNHIYYLDTPDDAACILYAGSAASCSIMMVPCGW